MIFFFDISGKITYIADSQLTNHPNQLTDIPFDHSPLSKTTHTHEHHTPRKNRSLARPNGTTASQGRSVKQESATNIKILRKPDQIN